MRWTAPYKGSRCRRVIVADESPERAVHEHNYHHWARPCKEGIPSPRRRCRRQVVVARKLRRKEGFGVLRQAAAVPRRLSHEPERRSRFREKLADEIDQLFGAIGLCHVAIAAGRSRLF